MQLAARERTHAMNNGHRNQIKASTRHATEQSKAANNIPSTALQTNYLPSFAQQRMWYLEQLQVCPKLYICTLAYRVHGVLDAELLGSCLASIVDRHEALRTTFHLSSAGELRTRIHEASCLRVPIVDVDANHTALSDSISELGSTPFDLTRGCMLRAKICKLSRIDHVVAICMHHIAYDGESINILLSELSLLYKARIAGDSSPLEPLSSNYVSYAAWQRNWLELDAQKKQLAFWQTQLSGDIPKLYLPKKSITRTKMQSHEGNSLGFNVPVAICSKLKHYSQARGATLFMVLLAVFKSIIHRYTGEFDIAVGIPIAGRARAAHEKIIGYFANTLVLRTDLSITDGQPLQFDDILRKVRDVALDAYSNQDIPFEKIVQEISPERETGTMPLFQIVFGMQQSSNDKLHLADCSVEEHTDAGRDAVRFELGVDITLLNDQLQIRVSYSTELYSTDTIDAFTKCYERGLQQLANGNIQTVDQFDLLSESNLRQQLVDFNLTDVKYDLDTSLIERFEATAKSYPGKVAIVCSDSEATYAEVDLAANSIAQWLDDHGVTKHDAVPLLMLSSIEQIICEIACLKVGAIFIPLDPEWPAQRILDVLRETKASVYLTTAFDGGEFECEFATKHSVNYASITPTMRAPSNAVHVDDPMYIIYTSGSTGKPKGAVNRYRGILNRLQDMDRRFTGAADIVTILTCAPFFDPSIWQIFWPLQNGGSVVIPDRHQQLDFDVLLRLISAQKVTIAHFVPSYLDMLVNYINTTNNQHHLYSLRQIIVGGEALHAPSIRELKGWIPGCEIANVYGPSETSVGVLLHTITDQIPDNVPIGRPLSNVKAVVVDQYLKPVPLGVHGELLIGGECVGLGYLNRPELTQKVFITNPFDSNADDTWYKTGDTVYQQRDGSICFVGRRDRQIKINGVRIELTEIEQVMKSCSFVKDAIVRIKELNTGQKILIGYALTGENSDCSLINIKYILEKQLPRLMQPQKIIFVTHWPLMKNGKLDIGKLPDTGKDIAATETVEQQNFDMSTNELLIVALCKDLLQLKHIDRTSSFFTIGGHSLLLIQLLSRIYQKTGVQLDIRAVFDRPQLQDIATEIDSAKCFGCDNFPEDTDERVTLLI